MSDIDNSYALVEGEDLVQVQSTAELRSVLSAYAELAGFLGINEGKGQVKLMTPEQRKAAKDTPFNVRRKSQIDQSLGRKPIIDGFIPAPVYFYFEEGKEADPLHCQATKFLFKGPTNSIMRPELEEKYADLLVKLQGVTTKITGQEGVGSFADMAHKISDMLRQQADDNLAAELSNEDMHYCDIAYRAIHVERYTDEQMRLTTTRWLTYPINMMDEYVKRIASKLLEF